MLKLSVQGAFTLPEPRIVVSCDNFGVLPASDAIITIHVDLDGLTVFEESGSPTEIFPHSPATLIRVFNFNIAQGMDIARGAKLLTGFVRVRYTGPRGNRYLH
jgi:hypothetical protein